LLIPTRPWSIGEHYSRVSDAILAGWPNWRAIPRVLTLPVPDAAFRRGEGFVVMIRWGFAVLLVAALLTQYTPVAFAGCEGGDSTMGHNAIAFCCGDGGGGQTGASRLITGHRARAK
jgi:hypothetical protein